MWWFRIFRGVDPAPVGIYCNPSLIQYVVFRHLIWSFLRFKAMSLVRILIQLSRSNFFICYCFLCCFFLFVRAPFKPASLNWAPLIKYCPKLKNNKNTGQDSRNGNKWHVNMGWKCESYREKCKCNGIILTVTWFCNPEGLIIEPKACTHC